jgi:hypothetical protein
MTEAPKTERPDYETYKVGDHATWHVGSDAFPYTVVKVSPSGKTITMRADKATIDPTWKMDFSPGGFVGHVNNNYEQRWIIEEDPNGSLRTARLTKRGWRTASCPGTRRSDISKAWRRFHDYNF